MTAKTQKAASARAGRDAYDDFLDGIVTTPDKKVSDKKGSDAKTPAKRASSGRSASAPKKSAGTASAAKKPSSAKKNTSSSAGKAASAGKKTASGRKSAAVEAGIVSLGSRERASRSAAPAKKSAPARRTGSVMVVDNPVARRDPWADPKKHPSSSRTAPAKRRTADASPRRTKPASSPRNGKNTRRMDRDDPYRAKKRRTADRTRNSGGKKRSRKKKNRTSGWDIFLSVGIACMLGFMLWQGTQYVNFLSMKQAVDRQTYYPGTTIEGIDVSDMTYDAAVRYWQTQVEPRYADRTVVFDGGESVKASQLGYSSDYMTVLTNAWSAGRSGTLEERYKAISGRAQTPVAYSVTRTPYTEAMVDKFVEYAAEKVDTPASEAKIQSFSTKTFKFTFSDPVAGKKLDRAALKAGVMQALDAGGGSVPLKVEEIAPASTKKSVSTQYGMITSAITNASSSSSNRLANIKRSLELINGTCLKPGETFSFNGVVGERTKARGFKEATAYSSGEVTEQVGGGICQVSTTLFNAAVKADLEINERHNHSLTVGYVDKGKDAAVNWGSQDLRFTNNTGDDIYICCYLTKDKRVRFGIFGKLLPNGETITVEGKTTGEIEFETEEQVSGLLAPGEKVVLQKGKNGFTAEAYKLRWDAKGNLLSRELLCKSKYKAVKEIIQYGP
ncbi:MAG: hypothetical protein E7337_07310 [Clostridiales bacterium]|nr:hypothetical protein [Clostridiales bacterium]